MLNYDAYTGKVLQGCASIIAQFIEKGITDATEINRDINKYLSNRYKDSPIDTSGSKQIERKLCPSCGNTTLLYKPTSLEGYPVNTCKCGYSQIAVK